MDPASPPQEAAVAGSEAWPGFYQCWTLAVAAILAIAISRASTRAWKRRSSIEREKEEQELVLARLRRRLQEEGQEGSSSRARTSGDRQTSQESEARPRQESAVETDGGPGCSRRPPSRKGQGGKAAPTDPQKKATRAGAAPRRQAGDGGGDKQPPPGGRGGQAVGLPEPYLPSLSPSPSSNNRASAAPPSSSPSPRPSPAAAGAAARTGSSPSKRQPAPPPSNPWSAGPVETLARYPFLREWASEMSQAATDLLHHASSSQEGVVVVGLVVKVLQNLLAHPHDHRYRSFRPAGSSSFRSLWRCPPAQALLRKLGFRPLRPAVATPAAASSSSSGERRPSQQGAVEEGDQGAEEEEEEEGGDVVVELPGLTEAHLEVIRKLLADSLLPFLLRQQQQQQGTARPAQLPSNSSGGLWSEGDLSCGVCGREELFVDREAARPEVLFRARHARVAVHCTSCALLVCGECYNLRGGSLPHDATHQMVLLAPADVGDELGQEEGEEGGGRWRRCPPVPRDRRPGRGPWG